MTHVVPNQVKVVFVDGTDIIVSSINDYYVDQERAVFATDDGEWVFFAHQLRYLQELAPILSKRGVVFQKK